MAVQVVLPRWPLLPREEHATVLRETLGSGRSVLLVGEAGVGKTQLVQSALAQGLPASVGPVVSVPGTIADDSPLEVAHPRLAAMLHDHESGAATTDPPPVLRVEDGHRLGPALAHAVVRLARDGAALLVTTLRPTAAAGSPWLELWRDGVAERLDVPTLTAAEVEELTVAVLGGPATADTYDRIVARSRGNAFFLRELLRAELEAGTLTEHRGVWRGPVDAPPNDRVIDVVRRSLDDLDPVSRRALDLVALADTVPVGAVRGPADAGTFAELVEHRLLVIDRGDGPDACAEPVLRLPHPMVAEAVRTLVPLDRRRRLYLSLYTPGGDGRAEPPDRLVGRVLWALDAGVREEVALLTAAADAALLLHRWQDAFRILRAALDRLPAADPARPRLLLQRATACQWSDEPGHALADLARARRHLAAMSHGPDRDALAVQLAERAADLARRSGDPDGGLAELRRTRAALGGDPAPEHELALRVSWLTNQGAAGRFEESLEPSLELLDGRLVRPELLPLVMPTAYGLGHSGRIDAARALAEQGLRLATASQDSRYPWQVDEIVVALGLALMWSGDVERFGDLVQGRGGARGYSEHEVFVQVGRGLLAVCHGRWTDAHGDLESALARYSVLDVSGISAYTIALAALAAAASGAAGRARELLTELPRTAQRSSAVVEPDMRLHVLDAGAWLREPTQQEDAMALAAWAAERGLRRTELEALHRAVVALGGRTAPVGGAVMARVRELGGLVSGPRAAALVMHAEAVARGDHQLSVVGAQELGRLGLWIPGRVAGAGLTRREREVAGLAAGGLTNREIAERFTLSVRTVDTHLARVFAKLGVHNRRELAEVMRG